MNERTRRVGPAILVECPWCEGTVELEADSRSIVCGDCRLVVELAADPPAMRAWTKQASAARS